jgi:hypothetical protein
MSPAMEEKSPTASPASVARRLADDGASIAPADLLDEDLRWRSARLFTAEELNFDTPAAAVAWMENLSARPDRDQLRQAVLSIKRELEFVISSQRTSEKERQLAAEIRQWLTVWLQNPQIFVDWFALRRETAEFLQIFGS